MTFTEPFRDPAAAATLTERIRRAADRTGPATLMEVCGTHTMAIARHGIRTLLPDAVRMVSGPGCPVCVTPVGYVDQACALARRADVRICTFGDLMRVPGTESFLGREAARGARVRVVLSALHALDEARAHPEAHVVFLAVGFETTAPTVAATLEAAEAFGVTNFYVLCAHKTVPAALKVLVSQPGFAVHGLLCPGHVSVVLGTGTYEPLASAGIPCVVAGFEPLDVLYGICRLLEQRARGEATVENAYPRAVRPNGNPLARAVMERVFEPCDARWRGLGPIPGSGLRLRPNLAHRDAALRFHLDLPEPQEPAGCLCGRILSGTAEPRQCPHFGTRCTPEDPVGACMVSSEGTCAAAHRYGTPDRGRVLVF